jgi:hypothetical protein
MNTAYATTSRMRLSLPERRTAVAIAEMLDAHVRDDIAIPESIFALAREYPDARLAVLAAAMAIALVRYEARQCGGFRQ